MDRLQNKRNQFLKQQRDKERELLYNDPTTDVEPEELILNQINEGQIDKTISHNEETLRKEEKNEQEQQQKEVVEQTQQTLQQVNKKLQEIKQASPQAVLNAVKEQLKPKQQKALDYVFNGEKMDRAKYWTSLKFLMTSYPYPEKAGQIWNQVMTGRRIRVSPASEQLKGNIFQQKLKLYKQGRESVQKMLDRLDYETKFMNEKPHKWYLWNLKRKGITNNRTLFTKVSNSEQMQTQAIEERRKLIKDKKERIQSQIDHYVKRANKKSTRTLKEYNKVLAAKNTLHTAQKSVLTFLIDKKGQQIDALKDTIRKEETQFGQYKQSVKKQVQQWETTREEQEKRLKKEIDDIGAKMLAEREQIERKDIEERKLRQELSKNENEKRKVELELHKKIEEQKLILNALEKKQSEQKVLLDQLKQINEKQALTIAQKDKVIEQQRQTIDILIGDNTQLREQNTQLRSQLTMQNQYITASNQTISQLQQRRSDLETMLNTEIGIKRQHQRKLKEIEKNQAVQRKKKQIAESRAMYADKIENAYKQMQKRAVLLQQVITKSNEQISILEKEKKVHEAELTRINREYAQETQRIKTIMNNQLSNQSLMVKERDAHLAKAQQEYGKLKGYLEGRQLEYQTYVQQMQKKIAQEQTEKKKLLGELDMSKNENKQLFAQYSRQIEILHRKQEQQRQAAARMAQVTSSQLKQLINKELTKTKYLQGRVLSMQKKQQEFLKKLNEKVEELERLRLQKERIEKQKEQEQKKKEKALQDKARAQGKLADVQLELKMTKQRLAVLEATSEIFETSFKYWQNSNTYLYTIRQCFRIEEKDKWIPSTRGINFTMDQKPFIQSVLQQWAEKAKDLLPRKKRIEKTQVLQIIDYYKGKKYFSMREGYYYAGIIQPTRRGFNISEDDLNSFLKGISKMESFKSISS